jgi:hypothetical protein
VSSSPALLETGPRGNSRARLRKRTGLMVREERVCSLRVVVIVANCLVKVCSLDDFTNSVPESEIRTNKYKIADNMRYTSRLCIAWGRRIIAGKKVRIINGEYSLLRMENILYLVRSNFSSRYIRT